MTFSTLKIFGFGTTVGSTIFRVEKVKPKIFCAIFHLLVLATGVTKKAVSSRRNFFIQCNLYQCVALEMHFHLICHMYLTFVGGANRCNYDL